MSSHSPSQSSRSRPCSDLAVRRTSRVLLDTCSLGGLEVGRHLSRLSFVTCFGARSPVKRFTCRVIEPSSPTLGRRHLSGASSKSPLYNICIARLLIAGQASRLTHDNHYTLIRLGCQPRPKSAESVADISLVYHRQVVDISQFNLMDLKVLEGTPPTHTERSRFGSPVPFPHTYK